MAVDINLDKVIKYSKENCFNRSQSKCAQYVKSAFKAGGANYYTGNGWDNQTFCIMNGFKCVGDFVPIDNNPRAHNGIGIQFPAGYQQRKGDICLIKHGQYGHICYAYGWGIDEWVSDYFQIPPGQQSGTGPYCYASGKYERIQFWRNPDINVGEVPTTFDTDYSIIEYPKPPSDPVNDFLEGTKKEPTLKKNVYSNVLPNGGSNKVFLLSESTKDRTNILTQDDERRAEFEALRNKMVSSTPKLGRDVMLISSQEMFDSNILKGNQESKKERT